MTSTPRFPSALLLLAAALLFGGCATVQKPIPLPYTMPVKTASVLPATQTAEVVTLTDTRVDRSLDHILIEKPGEFVRKALAAELEAGGAFARVSAQATQPASASVVIAVELRDISWAVPNHSGMVKTAFWTSFLTGGLGGLAYGSTDIQVFGHAAILLTVTERESGRVVFNEIVDALHEEKTIKLKCDTLETRSRVMGAALKAVLTKATQAVLKAQASPPPAPAAAAPSA